MPTFGVWPRFIRDYSRLSPEQKLQFSAAVRSFVAGLRARRLDPSLRIKRVRGAPGIWEISWAPDGRATFEYGPETHAGDPHVQWRRIGTHHIFREP